MLSSRLALRASRFVTRSGLYKLGGPTAAFRAPRHILPWEVVNANHNENSPLTVEHLHDEKFTYDGANALTSGPTASYVALTDDDFKRVPEGFCGELETEFLYVYGDTKKWMIRDAGKLTCRLIDDFKNSKQAEQVAPPPVAAHAPVDFEGLTDRPEWHDSFMNVEHFGKSLVNMPKISIKAAGSRTLEYEGADVVSDCVGAVKGVLASPDKIMLTGPRGVGKSVALNQAVLHARRNGWLVLFIPNGWEHAQLGSYVQPALLEGAPFKSSITFKSNNRVVTDRDELDEMDDPDEFVTDANTIFDNHELSSEALRGFYLAHKAELSQIPIRDVKIMDKYAQYVKDFDEAAERLLSVEAFPDKVTFQHLRTMIDGDDAIPHLDKLDEPVLDGFKYRDYQPSSLADLCAYGVAFRQLSGSIFIDLVEELRHYDNPDMPVMVAVDQFNNWEVPSAFAYNDEIIHAKQLCVPYALNFLSLKRSTSKSWNLKNGMAIATTCEKFVEGLKTNFKQQKLSLPLCITVPHYSSREYLSAVSYYTSAGRFAQNLELSDILGMRMYTASNPRLLRAQGVDFVLPQSIDYNLEASEAEGLAERRTYSSHDADEDMGEDPDDSDLDWPDDDDDEDEDEAPTNLSKKALALRAKAKADAQKLKEDAKAAKVAEAAAKRGAKFNKSGYDKYVKNKDKKFLKMKDGRA